MSSDLWLAPVAPYQVQEEALRRSADRPRWGHFLEQGLGKTLLTLAEFLHMRSQQRVNVGVVVCPNSLKLTWVEEAERVGITAHAWPNKINERGQIQIINYEATITPRGSEWLKQLVRDYHVMLVLDESAQIKNPRARRTRLLHQIGPQCRVRRLLSGAPMVQGPHDLWAQLKFLDAIPYNFFVFRSKFCKMGGWQGKQVVGVNDEAGLRALLAQFSWRARKSDWTDLPEKQYATREIEMVPEQRDMYREMLKDFVLLLCPHTPKVIDGEQPREGHYHPPDQCPEPNEIRAEIVITQMLKLQQISSGFVIDAEGRARRIPGADGKAHVTREIIEESEGKVMVVTLYKHSTAFLLEYLAEFNPARIHGDMTATVLQAEKARFNSDPACRVIVVQVQAGRYGHTLLGTKEARCATCVFYENSYSLDARIQTEDRIHRFGQDRSVLYVDLTSSKVDREVIRALQSKKDIAAAIIDGIRG